MYSLFQILFCHTIALASLVFTYLLLEDHDFMLWLYSSVRESVRCMYRRRRSAQHTSNHLLTTLVTCWCRFLFWKSYDSY